MTVRQFIRKTEIVWHVAMLLLMIGAFSVQWRGLLGGGFNIDEGNPYEQAILIFAYGVSLFILSFYIPLLIKIMIKTPWLWVLITFAFISFLWSSQPNITLRRSVSLVLASLYGIVLFIRFTPDQLLKLLSLVFIIIVLGSLVIIIIFPNAGIMSEPMHFGSWKGAFFHKNALGRASIIAMIVFMINWFTIDKTKKVFFIILFFLAFLLFIKANSTTALVIGLALSLIIFYLNLTARLRKHWAIVLIFSLGCLLLALYLFIYEGDFIFGEVLGKQTFLGRISLWQFLFNIGIKKPLLGFGYRSFWAGTAGPYLDVWDTFNWHPSHAHNGYVDLWLNLGLIGLLTSIILLIKTLFAAINNYLKLSIRDIKKYYFLLIILYCSFLILNNITESLYMDSSMLDSFYWILFVYFYTYLAGNKIQRI